MSKQLRWTQLHVKILEFVTSIPYFALSYNLHQLCRFVDVCFVIWHIPVEWRIFNWWRFCFWFGWLFQFQIQFKIPSWYFFYNNSCIFMHKNISFFKSEFIQKDYALNSDVFCARVCEFVLIIFDYVLLTCIKYSITSVKCFLLFQMLGSPESKPSFLSDKNLEPVMKTIQKKFPAIDTKSNSVCITWHNFK